MPAHSPGSAALPGHARGRGAMSRINCTWPSLPRSRLDSGKPSLTPVTVSAGPGVQGSLQHIERGRNPGMPPKEEKKGRHSRSSHWRIIHGESLDELDIFIPAEAQCRKQQVVSELSKLCRFILERHTTYCHFISNGKSLMFYDIF
jgi:hypothetical protein